jgi:hypothetical protein
MTTAEARDARRGWLPWLLGPIILPVLGAAAVVVLVENADLDGWPAWQAVAVLAAAFGVPALIAALVARRNGVVEAILWALACVGVEVALVFGVAFLALGLGPG